MIVHSCLLVVVLLTRDALTGDKGPPYEKTTSPKPKPGGGHHPTHISDFTNPNTGLNPFLDIPEGKTSAFGRRVMDRPTPNLDLTEGESTGRSWPQNSVQTEHVQPNAFDFAAYAEDDNPFVENEEYAESPVTSEPEFDDVVPVTSKLKTPFFVTLTALAIGALVVLVALAIGVRWKRRTRAPSDVEVGQRRNSENSCEKSNTVDSPSRK